MGGKVKELYRKIRRNHRWLERAYLKKKGIIFKINLTIDKGKLK